MLSARHSRQILMTELHRNIFENYLQKQKFHKIRPLGASCFIRTDRHDEANSRFSRFCKRAKKIRPCDLN